MTRTNVSLNVVANDSDEAQTIANALAGVLSTLVRNGATDVSLRLVTWDDDEEDSEEDGAQLELPDTWADDEEAAADE